jgi:hypothetical protein
VTLKTSAASAFAALSFLGCPVLAHADWYLSRADAKQAAREAVHARYGFAVRDVYARCRPRDGGDAQQLKHRWVCGWSDVSFYASGEDPCPSGKTSTGKLAVVGAAGRGAFRHRVLCRIACRRP